MDHSELVEELPLDSDFELLPDGDESVLEVSLDDFSALAPFL